MSERDDASRRGHLRGALVRAAVDAAAVVTVAASGRRMAALVVGVVSLLNLVLVVRSGRDPIGRLVSAVGRLLAGGVLLLLGALGWLLLVVPLGLLRHISDLVPARRPSSLWMVPSLSRDLSQTPYAVESLRPVAPAPTRPVRVLARVTVVAAAFALVAWSTHEVRAWLNDRDAVVSERQRALELRPDSQGPMEEISRAWSRARYRPFIGWYVPDFHGRVINVTDGERRTVEPQLDGPDRKVIWFFGGSTMFGFGLQDDHTIPSAFVRAADRAGVPVEVNNFGVPAFTHFQGALLFAQLLSERPAPDLAVFYDGINDTVVGLSKNLVSEVFPNDPAMGGDVAFGRAFNDANLLPDLPRTEEDPTPPFPSPDEAIDGMIASYRRGSDLATAVGAAHGVTVVNMWQPLLYTMAAPEPYTMNVRNWLGDSAPVETFEGWRNIYAVIAARLPDDVVNLGSVLDGTTSPVFGDEMHVDDAGAEVIGAAVFDRLDERIRDARPG